MAFLLGIMGLLIYFFFRGATYEPPADRKYDQYVMQTDWPCWIEKCSEQWWFEHRPDTAKAWRDWQAVADIRMDKVHRKNYSQFYKEMSNKEWDIRRQLVFEKPEYKTLSDEEIQSLNRLRDIPVRQEVWWQLQITTGFKQYNTKGYTLSEVQKETKNVEELVAMAFRGRIPSEAVAMGIPTDCILTPPKASVPLEIEFQLKRNRLTHYKFMLWYNQELKKHGLDYDMYLIKGNGTIVDPNNLDEVLAAYKYIAKEIYSHDLKPARRCSHFIWEPMIRFRRDPDENIWYNTYNRACAPPPLSRRR